VRSCCVRSTSDYCVLVIVYKPRSKDVQLCPSFQELLHTLSDLLKVNPFASTKWKEKEPGAAFQMDITLESDKGTRKHLSVALVENMDSGVETTGYIVVVSDMTTRRQAEEEREQQRRVIDLYASLLSHDVGNDLQAVLGYVEGASLLIDTDMKRALEMLESAQAAGQRMANLIHTFRIESSPSHIQIVPMLREAASQAEKVNMGLQVQVHAEPDALNLRSPGGPLLPIAVANILRNAAQHAGKNPKVHIAVHRESTSLNVLISDDGPGVKPMIRESLFKRSSPDRENGLGLYLTKQIITACGGGIELVDDANVKGATFKITLPIME
jgi:signal transduction histidine kinase